MLARWIDETLRFNDAPLVPLAAQGAALNLLNLERVVRWTRMVQVNGAQRWLTFELSGPQRLAARNGQ